MINFIRVIKLKYYFYNLSLYIYIYIYIYIYNQFIYMCVEQTLKKIMKYK